MSLLHPETVQAIAECYGFPDLSEEVTTALTADLEYRIRELTQEAAKFTRHSKRRKLTTNDINTALRLRNLEPMYGYTGTSLNPDQKGKESLFKKVGASDTYYIPDEVVDLSKFLKMPVPKCPPDLTFTSHWLAVEGVQPAISQNPPVVVVEQEETKETDSKVEEAGASTSSSKSSYKAGKKAKTGKSVKPIVKHDLSREQQIYYRSVTEGLLTKDKAFRSHALESLEQDPGLHQLLPYFMKFIAEEVVKNLGNLEVLSTLIAFAAALLKNPNLYPEPYLHLILPAVLTCVVGKSLCKRSDEDHWTLRKNASLVVKHTCEKFKSYASIQARVTKTMVGALLDPSKPLATHFGAICTLEGLGPNVVDVLLMDSVEAYAPFLRKKLNDSDRTVRSDALRVETALLDACGKHLQWQRREQLKNSISDVALPPVNSGARYKVLKDLFGDRLNAYID